MSDINKPDANKNAPNNSSSKMDQLVAGHDYDGIQEFGNPAPFWWQLFFYISIVFGIGYFTYYQFLGGPTLDQELAVKLEAYKAAQAHLAGDTPDQAKLEAIAADPAKLALGQKVFAEKCLACHAADGGGLVGPNLTDNYWIHNGGSLLAIYKVVKEGIGDKGMPAWGALLSEDEVQGVTVFVKALKGKQVVTAKEPQGVLVTE